MLTRDERWRLNLADKHLRQGNTLLEECRVRSDDPDSMAVLAAYKKVVEAARAVDEIVRRLGEIPQLPAPRRSGPLVLVPGRAVEVV